MKAALVFLLSAVHAVRLTEPLDYEEVVEETHDEIKKTDTWADMLAQQTNMLSQDKTLIAEYGKKLEQSHRNVNQGIMGRSLAQDKLSDVKTSFSQISQNIKKEGQNVKKMLDAENKKDTPDLNKPISMVEQMKKTASKVNEDVKKY